MIIVNTPNIPGRDYEVITLVKGNTVQTKHIGKDIAAGFQTIVGGEIKGYTEMLTEAREIAISRMVEEASKVGADAIINMRFATSQVMEGASEIIAYGTAIKFK